MKTNKCPSRFIRAYNDFKKLTISKKILYIIMYIVVIIVFFSYLNKSYEYYFFIPTGKYIKMLDYFLLPVFILYSIYLHKIDIKINNKCKYGINDYLKNKPIFHYIVTLIYLFIMYVFLLHFIGFTATYFDLKNNDNYKYYKLNINDIDTSSIKNCKVIIKTNLYDKIENKNKAFLYKFTHLFNFDRICTTSFSLDQKKMLVEVKETPWYIAVQKIYPDDINSRVK